MGEYLKESWYILVIVAVGLVGTVAIYGPMVVARARMRLSPRQYFAKTALVSLFGGAIVGSVGVPFLQVDTVPFVVGGLLLLGILVGWLLMFENDAVRFKGWLRVLGPIDLDSKRMAQPVVHSWTLTALFLIVGLMGGICVRLLLLASA